MVLLVALDYHAPKGAGVEAMGEKDENSFRYFISKLVSGYIKVIALPCSLVASQGGFPVHTQWDHRHLGRAHGGAERIPAGEQATSAIHLGDM